ncbi:MAG TPA: CBS domain-containing protein, partial [Acidimicrobiales bacterium]|nr:CBS domain-containing protein [Acidimicrobiales bacterium]
LGSPATPFVADFVGADRGLRRLTVTAIDVADLNRPPLVHDDDSLAEARRAMDVAATQWAVVVDRDNQLRGWIGRTAAEDGAGNVADRTHRMEAWVPLGASLKQAFSEMLQHDAGWVAVLDGARFMGVLTPDSLHSALRRSIDDEAGVALEASPLRL